MRDAEAFAVQELPELTPATVLQHYEELAFPPLAGRLERRPPRGPWAGAVALGDGGPIGLGIVELPPDARAQVVSLAVVPAARRWGVGSALLARLERLAAAGGAADIEGAYRTSWRSRRAIEALLAARGWSPPETRLVLARGARATARELVRRPAPPLPPEAELFTWGDLDADERREILARQDAAPWFPEVLTPFQEEGRLEPAMSVGLRWEGEVAGWLIVHRVGFDTVQYSAHFLRADLRGRGLGQAILAETVRRRLADPTARWALVAIDARNEERLRAIAGTAAPLPAAAVGAAGQPEVARRLRRRALLNLSGARDVSGGYESSRKESTMRFDVRNGRGGWIACLMAACALGTAGTSAAEDAERYTRRVALVVYDGVELLDFAGPGEVFQAAGGFGASGEDPAFEIYTVGRTRAPIVSQGFVEVVPGYGIADAPLPDVLVLPGGSSARVSGDPEFLAWVKRAAEGAEITLTVCTGAFMLGEAGLLDGREVTTWYNALDRLQARFPEARAQHGRRFIDSGTIVTTAGVSAGIDGSLHVVARLLGRRVADATARYMEYHWTPEAYLARDYTDENPSLGERGRAVAAADAARQRADWPSAVAAYRALTASDPEDGRSWLQLGNSHYGGGDMAAAAVAHERAAAFEGQRPTALYNLACDRALLGDADAAVAALERAVEAGFDDASYLLTDEDLASLRDDPRFQALVESLR